MDATPTIEDPIDDKPMPLLDHLIELRRRLMWSMAVFLALFGICWTQSTRIYDILADPLNRLLLQHPELQGSLIGTSLTSPFLTYIKVSVFGAIFIGFPIFASQVWLFVAPGLYRSEKRALLPFLLAAPLLFLLGASIAYFFVFRVAWGFFLGYFTAANTGSIAIRPMLDVNLYLGLVMKLLFAFGVTFEVPVLLTLLAKVGIISSAGMKKTRRYAYVGMFVIAAVLAPPDVYSQIALALMLLVLYEVSIIVAGFVEPKPTED